MGLCLHKSELKCQGLCSSVLTENTKVSGLILLGRHDYKILLFFVNCCGILGTARKHVLELKSLFTENIIMHRYTAI